MLNFMKNWIQNRKQQNNEEAASAADAPQVQKMRQRVTMQAGLAVLTIVLTAVLIFAMTAAWYTNVVKTSGLIFQVEQWGVDVGAEIDGDVILMSPGQEGIVSFTASNTSETDIVNIGVTVSKTGMEEQMQRRLYFYVEDNQTVKNEELSRIYLTSDTGYDYMLLPGETLTINQEYYNNAPLKWHWVSNVVGYYVRATVNTDGTLAITEYLRPVEYDYTTATFDTDGNLLTVDGAAVSDFLVELTQHDGYAGSLTATDTATNGYYTIVPSYNTDTGVGIYLVMLNKTQIEAENAYDAELLKKVKADEVLQYTVNFTIYAENYEVTAVAVTNDVSLIEKLSDSSVSVVQLADDIEMTSTVTVPANADVILDLAGNTLTTNTEDPAITVAEGGSLTLYNGSMVATAENASAAGVYCTGGEVTMQDVTLMGYEDGIVIADQKGAGTDSVVRLTGCEITSTWSGLWVKGNGSLSSDTDTTVIIENCKIYGKIYGLFGNGSVSGTGNWGTDIQIINSTIASHEEDMSCAIFQPQPVGTLNIVGSTVIGHTGMSIRGGTVTIKNSQITGTGQVVDEPHYEGNGTANTGDAIYIDDGYAYEIYVEVDSATTLTSYYAQALRVFEADSPYVTLVSNCENMKSETEGTATIAATE